MSKSPNSEANPQPLSHFLPLFRGTVSHYLRHIGTLLAISAVRLVPFYVFLWFFPIKDRGMAALAETLIIVPCAGALVRFVWGSLIGVRLSMGDAVLGVSPADTVRLLVTDLLIVLVTILLMTAGPGVFLGFLLVWSWVTLVTDQVVIIERRLLLRAVGRSLELVREAWQLSTAALLVISLPDVAAIAVSLTMPNSVWREVITRGITVLALPFSVVYLTLLYEHHLVSGSATGNASQ